MKVKLDAIDNVGNISSDISDTAFEVDSTNPVITINYAGNGGSTPANNSYINNSGFDISANITDANLSGGNIYYSFYNQTTGNYWNGTSYSGSTEIWNTITSATGSSFALSSTLTPLIGNGNFYKLKLKADDVVGNTFSTAQTTYVGDTINPVLTVGTASGSYVRNSITITGSTTDTGSSMSSVSIEIQK